MSTEAEIRQENIDKQPAEAGWSRGQGNHEMDSSSEGEEADEETFIEIISTEPFPSEAVKRVNHE